MTLPKDPIKREAYLAAMKERVKRRWEDPAQREAARKKTIEQFSDPEKRARHQGAVIEAMQDPETIRKLSEAHKGKILPAGQREKIGAAHRGRKHPPETGERIADKARERWASYTYEQKMLIMDQIRAGVAPDAAKKYWEGLSPEERERKSKESRQHMLGYWDSLPAEEKTARMAAMTAKAAAFWKVAIEERLPAFSKRTAAIMKANQIKPNRVETALQDLLDSICPGCYQYVGDGSLVIGGKCPDFVCGDKIVELFGDYWHKGEDPELKKAYFKDFGYRTLVIWEHEMLDENLPQRIVEFHNASV